MGFTNAVPCFPVCEFGKPKQLVLDWETLGLSLHRFHSLLQDSRNFSTQSITSLVLYNFAQEALELVCEHFRNLKRLKLATKFWDPEMILLRPIRRLKHLKVLILINYDISSQFRIYPLRSITKLRICCTNSWELNALFYDNFGKGLPTQSQIAASGFKEQLFKQFPNLKELELAGRVIHAKTVEQRLCETLKEDIVLSMIFEDPFVPEPKKRRKLSRSAAVRSQPTVHTPPSRRHCRLPSPLLEQLHRYVRTMRRHCSSLFTEFPCITRVLVLSHTPI